MYSTRVSGRVRAPRAAVYQAFVDAEAIAAWRVPDDMSAQVHAFEPREGGAFRVSLTYDAPNRAGKSSGRTDTYHGHFAELVPSERVVEVFEFETDDAALQGVMTMTTTLAEADDGTEVVIAHEGVPDAVPPADNETGMRMALANLAAYVEARRAAP
jgi:uncharacterized protein YndB with AHSA1/START domain